MRKLAVILPGIGYTFDRPLLSGAESIAEHLGFEIRRVPFSGFPKNAKGDPEKMRESFEIACRLTKESLIGVPFRSCSRVVFISKSIGTVAAAWYEAETALVAENIYFTPVGETFRFIGGAYGKGIAFHGTDDPWTADTDIGRECRTHGIRYYEIPGANHSLLTGDEEKDAETLRKVLAETEKALKAE